MLGGSKNSERAPRQDNDQFSMYYLDNMRSALCCSPTLVNCKFVNEVFPIKRKFQDMRAIMKKVHQISKTSGTLIQERKSHNLHSKSSAELTDKPGINQSPYIVHRFIKSKRLMVTSTSSLLERKKSTLKPLQRQQRFSGRQKNMSKQQLAQIQRIYKVTNKLKNYFQKNLTIYDKISAFQSPDIGLFQRKGTIKDRQSKISFDSKQNNE